MEYNTAIERACKHAYENADEQTRNSEYGQTYLKAVARARFFELVAENDVDLSDHSIGSISVDLLKGISAVREALDGQ